VTTPNNWHLTLFKKSILKQQKLKAISLFLAETSGKKCLDIGGDNGIISYFLRKAGGEWTSADLEDESVDSIRALVQTNVYKIDGESTPFANNSFDTVVIIDFLEHIRTDALFIEELERIIKPGGELIINVPHYSRRFSMLRTLKNTLNLTDEEHGHVRPGYDLDELSKLLSGKFEIERSATYIKFFSELIDIMIRFLSARGEKKGGEKGALITQETFKKKTGMFKLYSAIFPVLQLVSKLDACLFFTKGASLIIKAKPA
jgi:SAM-dependent methyltransferase